MVYHSTSDKIRLVLKELRLKNGLTQEGVATSMGVSKSYISQVELGKCAIPKYQFLIKLLEVYRIKPKYFEELLSKRVEGK